MNRLWKLNRLSAKKKRKKENKSIRKLILLGLKKIINNWLRMH